MADYPNSGHSTYQQPRGMAPPQTRVNAANVGPPLPGAAMPGGQFGQKMAPGAMNQPYGTQPRPMGVPPPGTFGAPPQANARFPGGMPPPNNSMGGGQYGAGAPPPRMEGSAGGMRMVPPSNMPQGRPTSATPMMAPPIGSQNQPNTSSPATMNKSNSYPNMSPNEGPPAHVNGVSGPPQMNALPASGPRGVAPPQMNGPVGPSHQRPPVSGMHAPGTGAPPMNVPRTVGPPPLPGQTYSAGLPPTSMGGMTGGIAPPPSRLTGPSQPGIGQVPPGQNQAPLMPGQTYQQRPPLPGQQGPSLPGQRPPLPGQGPPLPGQGHQGPLLPGQGQRPLFPGQGQNPPTYSSGVTRPVELPVPYHGRAQYSHQLGPPSSGQKGGLSPASESPSVSARSSRVPSPVPGQHFDAMEGQFSPQQPGAPPQPGIPQQPGMPPQPGIPQQPGIPPQPGLTAPPGPGDMNQRSGIASGRRQYPQMPPQFAQPPGMTAPAPGMMPAPGGAPVNNMMHSAAGSGGGGMPNHHGHHHDGMGGINNSFSNMKMQPQYPGADSRSVNLLQERVLIQSDGIEDMKPNLSHDWKKVNCSPDIFRCTLSSIPQTQSLLNKSRLPLGILIHPFKDLSQLPVIQSSVIVRCRSCRTYINPFVSFVDMRRWKCNLCFRVNELPEEFNFDPVSKSYGEPQRRPEVRSSTIEFIAPSEYMLRPPQPAVYLYVLDVSFNAAETGYLSLVCQTILDELERIPGDSRTQIGFITFDSSLHFYNLDSSLSQPQMMIVSDVDDVFLPCPDGLLVNLHESKSLISDLLSQLPEMFEKNRETGNAMGAALQASLKLMNSTGGRVTVFQTQLPTVGPGALKCREDPNERAGKNISHLGPATDFYKKLALDCAAQQVAVDLFMLNGQYADIASVACISKYSSGCLHYYPQYHSIRNPAEAERLENDLRRYLTRKIGFEAVMRIRCTKGLSIHTFHGNFFVRSTDLLSLPNINPDAAFGMQMSIEDNLTESSNACFQAALLYTSSKGERRIRVHTLCVPITAQLSDVFSGADQKAILGLLAKMAADRSVTSSVSDARDALNYAAVDMLSAYGSTLSAAQKMGMLPCPYTLRLMPIMVTALLKYTAFRLGTSTRLDDRVFALEQCKTLPLQYMLQMVYPDLYPVHALDERSAISKGDTVVCQPPRRHLSSAHIDRHGVYLLDAASHMYLYVGAAVSDRLCQEMLDLPNFSSIPDGLSELPELDNPTSENLRNFVSHLQDQRPFYAPLLVVREDSRNKMQFMRHLVDDRTESSLSYYEYVQHLQKEVKS